MITTADHNHGEIETDETNSATTTTNNALRNFFSGGAKELLRIGRTGKHDSAERTILPAVLSCRTHKKQLQTATQRTTHTLHCKQHTTTTTQQRHSVTGSDTPQKNEVKQ